MDNYALTNAPTATQTPAIDITVRQLEKQLAELSEIAATLESRLTTVMREPEPSQVRPDNPGTTPAQSQLAVMLRQRVQEAESISCRLTSIMRRLEI